MFTNIDKFDWYVEGNTFSDLQKEKHPPKPITFNTGFWCTGSWFPGKKYNFYNTFYSQDYFCTKTIQQILLFRSICNSVGAKHVVLFDSPIWNFTEQTINNFDGNPPIKKQWQENFLKMPLSSKWQHMLDEEDEQIKETSLLGYCWCNNLKWHSSAVGPHPPSSSHWNYYQNILKPKLQNILKFQNINFGKKIQFMDSEWKKY
jgi:hypothetical protein